MIKKFENFDSNKLQTGQIIKISDGYYHIILSHNDESIYVYDTYNVEYSLMEPNKHNSNHYLVKFGKQIKNNIKSSKDFDIKRIIDWVEIIERKIEKLEIHPISQLSLYLKDIIIKWRFENIELHRYLEMKEEAGKFNI